MKVAVIGAGSVGFTRKLVRDLLKVPELQDTEFALHDINAENLGMVTQILERDVAANRLPARVTSTLDRRTALEGARYVICCVRIGGLDAFAQRYRGAAPLRRRPVRRRHDLRRRHHVRPAHDPADAGFLRATSAPSRSRAPGCSTTPTRWR